MTLREIIPLICRRPRMFVCDAVTLKSVANVITGFDLGIRGRPNLKDFRVYLADLCSHEFGESTNHGWVYYIELLFPDTPLIHLPLLFNQFAAEYEATRRPEGEMERQAAQSLLTEELRNRFHTEFTDLVLETDGRFPRNSVHLLEATRHNPFPEDNLGIRFEFLDREVSEPQTIDFVVSLYHLNLAPKITAYVWWDCGNRFEDVWSGSYRVAGYLRPASSASIEGIAYEIPRLRQSFLDAIGRGRPKSFIGQEL